MLKYYLIGVIAFILLCTGFWAQHTSLVQLRKDLGAANTQLTDLNTAYTALSARTDAIQVLTAQAAKDAQENRNALQKAIRALPDGGGRSTPAVIVDRLCKSLKCAKGDVGVQPVPTTGR
jgi:DNA-binding Xre family transcriptional regulator